MKENKGHLSSVQIDLN